MIILINTIIVLFDKASYKSASWSGSALAIQINIHTHRNDRPRRQVLLPLIFANSLRVSSFTSQRFFARARALSHVAYGLSEKPRKSLYHYPGCTISSVLSVIIAPTRVWNRGKVYIKSYNSSITAWNRLVETDYRLRRQIISWVTIMSIICLLFFMNL